MNAEVPDGRPFCRVCGSPRPAGPRRVTCGAVFCVAAWQALRYVVDVEQWAERARRLGVTVPGEWGVRGARPMGLALECLRRDLPIASEFPAWLTARVAEHGGVSVGSPPDGDEPRSG